MKLLTIVLAGILALGALSAAAEEQMTCCNATYADGVYTIENTATRNAYVKYVYEWNQTEVKPFYFGGEYFAQAADPKDKAVAAIRVDLEFTDGTKLPWVNIGMPNNTKFTKTVRPFTAKKPIKTATLIAQFNRVGKVQMRGLFAKEGVLPVAAPAKPAPKAPPAGFFGSKTNVPDGENWVTDPMNMVGATFKDGVYTFDNAAPNKAAALRQTFKLDQQEAKPFTFSVESKGVRPEGAEKIHYAIFVDITHQDGTRISCINMPLPNSADKFTKLQRTFVPTKPVKTATLFIWCKVQGKAEFKNPTFVCGK